MFFLFFFFFKQKTAYEMRISDWSSDVCSSDLKHQNGRLLNAITAPNVLIREAVLASCAVPGVFPPVMLMARGEDGARVPYQPDRRWVDGSVTHDIPPRRIERLHGFYHHKVQLRSAAWRARVCEKG